MNTNTNDGIEILNEVTCFNLNISLWTGRKKLKLEDLKLADGSEVPPSTLASLGSFKTIDSKIISDFEKIKKRMQRTLEQRGVRFLGGSVYALPNEKVKDAREILNDLVTEALDVKHKFLAEYDTNVNEWIASNDEWQDLIAKAITPKAVVDSRIQFGYSCFSINPAADGLGSDELGDEAMGLTGQLYKEIAQAADDLFDKSLSGKPSASQKVKGAINKLREKLDGLAFLDKRVLPLVNTIDQVIGTLPKTGPIENSNLASLTGLVLLLSQPDKMKKHGEGLLPLSACIPSMEQDEPEQPIIIPSLEQDMTSAPVVVIPDNVSPIASATAPTSNQASLPAHQASLPDIPADMFS